MFSFASACPLPSFSVALLPRLVRESVSPPLTWDANSKRNAPLTLPPPPPPPPHLIEALVYLLQLFLGLLDDGRIYCFLLHLYALSALLHIQHA